MKDWTSVSSEFLSFDAQPLYDHHPPEPLHSVPIGLREQEYQREHEMYGACCATSNSFLC